MEQNSLQPRTRLLPPMVEGGEIARIENTPRGFIRRFAGFDWPIGVGTSSIEVRVDQPSLVKVGQLVGYSTGLAVAAGGAGPGVTGTVPYWYLQLGIAGGGYTGPPFLVDQRFEDLGIMASQGPYMYLPYAGIWTVIGQLFTSVGTPHISCTGIIYEGVSAGYYSALCGAPPRLGKGFQCTTDVVNQSTLISVDPSVRGFMIEGSAANGRLIIPGTVDGAATAPDFQIPTTSTVYPHVSSGTMGTSGLVIRGPAAGATFNVHLARW